MHTARRYAHALLVLVVALVASLGMVLAAPATTPDRAPAPSTVIYEDDPRWDCATMGNRICGPVLSA